MERTWKGLVRGYIISNKDYKHFDYWDSKYWIDGVNGNLNLPYKYENEFSGWGTVDILKDLIINC